MSGSTPDPLAEQLRAEFAAIGVLLEGKPEPARRDEAKRRIITLFKRVEAMLGELTELKESIRGLVDRYKQLAAEDGADAARRLPELRRDHLGASTFVEKGWSLISLGDPVGAMQALRRALELAPEDPQAESLLGWAQLQSGQLEAALATFSSVLAREPANALARVNVGYLCFKQRSFGEAIEHLSRVIRLDNDRKACLYAHYYLGLVYLERGMFEDAQSFLAKALALGPNLLEAYHELGRAQWFAGQQEEARESWTRGAAASQTSPWATACKRMLDSVAKGEEVPRSAAT